MTDVKHKVLVIGGPTASGKSGLALSAAQKYNGVIINADSMQLYDGLGILTAQPTSADKAAVPHALYGILPPADICSAARYARLALAEIENVIAAGKLPIVVGGTGFYLKALLKGLSPIPSVPDDIRAVLIARAREMGTPAFYAEFASKDPETAAKIDRDNPQRIVRAYEVLEATGKSLAYWQSLPPEPPPAHLQFIVATLVPPRAKLYAQCDSRFSQMLAAGALEEVRKFKETARPEMPLVKALGYAELASHLDGNITLTEAITLSQNATRQYAKRQVTWFRHQIVADTVLEMPDAALLDSRLA